MMNARELVMPRRMFGAGPGRMPAEISEKVAALIERPESYLLELSDRSEAGAEMLRAISSLSTELLDVPEDFELVLVPGGGTQQFLMAAFSLQSLVDEIQFIETDHWSRRAREEMAAFVRVRTIFDGAETGYASLPTDQPFRGEPSWAVFLTSNNTAAGTQWRSLPPIDGFGVRVVDISSDAFIRRINYDAGDCFFACAQKNFGVAGLSIAVIRRSLLDAMPKHGLLSYRAWRDAGSTTATFPMLTAVVTLECLRYIHRVGLEEIRKTISRASSLLYEFLDSSSVLLPRVRLEDRSLHNVTFNFAARQDVRRVEFLQEAARVQLEGLKGHPSVGGLRASFYFGASYEDAEALVNFLGQF
jgi:phosphoserine aminotransferase